MKKHSYFSRILEEEKEYMPNVYRRNVKRIFHELEKKNIKVKKAFQVLNEYGRCWDHSMFDKIYAVLLIIIATITPKFITRVLISARDLERRKRFKGET